MTWTLIGGAVAGGVIAWVWGAISWMALPWHHATFLAFSDESEIERAILASAPVSGVYGLPAPPRTPRGADRAAREAADRAAQQRMIAGPIVTAVVQRHGFGSVPLAMLRAFVIYAAASLVLTWLLLHTADLSYWRKVGFVAAVGLAAGLICRLPDWNWHGYSTSYTAVSIADHVVGAFLVGLALAKMG
ncbi:MAG TPA: hypothetical protein VH679_09880 [Vicinamibacterales bacterium]